jgi:hypothetical protein
MQGLLRGTGLFLILVLAAPVPAADEKKVPDPKPKGKVKKDAKKKKPAKKKKKKEDAQAKAEKVVYGATVIGVLTQVSAGSQKDFSLEITRRYVITDPTAAANLLALQQQQRAALFIRDPVQRQQTILQVAAQMAAAQRTLYRIQLTKSTVELHAADDMKVRTSFPPLDYDEKGNPKKYTLRELKALKGPGKLPGYPAEFDNLRANQVVRVYLPKALPPAPRKKGKKKGDPDAADDDLAKGRPEVVMVLVLHDAPKK